MNVIYLIMYKSHERAEYVPVMAYKNESKAEHFILGTMIGSHGATCGFDPYIVKEVQFKE